MPNTWRPCEDQRCLLGMTTKTTSTRCQLALSRKKEDSERDVDGSAASQGRQRVAADHFGTAVVTAVIGACHIGDIDAGQWRDVVAQGRLCGQCCRTSQQNQVVHQSLAGHILGVVLGVS